MMKEAPIYTITAIPPVGDVKPELHRVFGYFHWRDDALKAVAENRCNMHECLYEYLVIETVYPGIHPLPDEELWYKWNEDKGAWEQSMKPSRYRGVIAFAMG